MGQIRTLTSADDRTLTDFLGSCEGATIYHTPAWRDTIVSTYGYRPIGLGCFEGERLTAVLPLMFVKSWLTGNRLVSLPFANICGPLGSPDGTAALVEHAVALRGELGAKALEIRTQAGINAFDDHRFTKLTYFITSVLRLDPDPARVWDGFKGKNVRTEVRQAEKKGIEVRDGEGPEDLKRFYQLFSDLRLKHGVPPQPYAFFANLWKHLRPDNCHLHLAAFQGRTVAGMLTLGYGATTSGAYLGSDLAYRSYRVHQILYWKAMERGCLKGYRTFDFLRSPRNDEGLKYFKSRWGVTEVDLAYLYHPQVAGTASTVEETAKYKLMAATLQRAPKGLGRALGRMLYKHLG